MPGVARSGQRAEQVRALSEYQRAPWELGMDEQGPDGLPETGPARRHRGNTHM